MSESRGQGPRGVTPRGVTPRRTQLSGRTMMVAVMALFLVVILASPLQTYLSRREAVAASERQQRQLQSHVAQLRHEGDQWSDPAYVERQARARLRYIRPGDTLYTVLNPDGTPRSSTSTSSGVEKSGHLPSWNSNLWSSVTDADNAK
jgi:cell division protein FtsB